jgi:hypothetical protein
MRTIVHKMMHFFAVEVFETGGERREHRSLARWLAGGAVEEGADLRDHFSLGIFEDVVAAVGTAVNVGLPRGAGSGLEMLVLRRMRFKKRYFKT